MQPSEALISPLVTGAMLIVEGVLVLAIVFLKRLALASDGLSDIYKVFVIIINNQVIKKLKLLRLFTRKLTINFLINDL